MNNVQQLKTQFQMVQDAWKQFEDSGEITGDVASNLLSVVSDLKASEVLHMHKASQPTIADYIKANEADWKKCHRTMVNIEDLRNFKGVSDG